MNRNRPFIIVSLLLLAGLCLVTGGCAVPARETAAPSGLGVYSGAMPVMAAPALFHEPEWDAAGEEAAEEEADEEEGQSALATALLYIPNRIFDLFDMVRAGVNVGPGLGIDVRATKWAKVIFATDTSVGVGFQGLRHLPVCIRSRAKLGLAFISTPDLNVLDWYHGDYDLRIELHLLLVGAHVAVDFGEIFDFLGGLFTWDPMEDDFIVG